MAVWSPVLLEDLRGLVPSSGAVTQSTHTGCCHSATHTYTHTWQLATLANAKKAFDGTDFRQPRVCEYTQTQCCGMNERNRSSRFEGCCVQSLLICVSLVVYNNNKIHFRDPASYLTYFRSRDKNKYSSYERVLSSDTHTHTYIVSIYSSMWAKWLHCLSFFSPSLNVHRLLGSFQRPPLRIPWISSIETSICMPRITPLSTWTTLSTLNVPISLNRHALSL